MLFKFGGLFRKVWRGALILGTLVIGTNTLFVAPVYAATGINQQLNFQGRLLNAQGAVAPDGFYNVEFKIYQDGTGTLSGNPSGTLKWTEDWLNSGSNSVQIVNGYISVQLGSVNAFGNSVDWNQDTLWLSVNIGNTSSCTITTNFTSNCGGDGEMLPMKRLSAVPYSLNSAKLGGLTAAGFIQNTTTVQTTANLAIDGTARADTSILTPTVDTNTAVALNIGTTNATVINLNENVTVAATKTLRMAGDTRTNITAIATPAEGMMTYDTTNKQLLVYANGKWQGDRSTATKIVAASNASQTLKDGADYVATGTSDQNIINTALTAAAGGSVYLTEGTFTTDDVISIPNDTTLGGAGRGSLIKFANIAGQTKNMITNTDTTATSKGVTVRDLQLDGNWTGVNTTGTMSGIAFSSLGGGSGSSARQGPTILNTWVNNFLTNNIYLLNSPNGVVSGNNVQAGGGNGIYLSSSNRTSVTGNVSQGNTGSGIVIGGEVAGTVTGNTFAVNGTAGVYLNGGSSNNTISGNNLYNNGSGTANNSFLFPAAANADSNTITGNTINDTSGTTTNYAINITDNTSNSNYFADNVFTSTAGTSTINDPAGTNTVYANQPRAEGGAKLTNRTVNDTEAFAVQTAAGANVFAVDTTNSQVVLGTSSTAGKLTINDGSGHTGTILMGTVASNYTYTVPTTTANDTFCMVGLNNCAANSALFVQNQNTAQQATSNYWISGSGRADTSILTPLLDAATSSTALNIGTTNASVINLNQNVTVAAGKSLTITGSGTRPVSPTEGMLYYDTGTHQLVQWNGTKWADNGNSAYLVAANNSSQADKDAADYVAPGTGDQSTIQSALDRADPASAVSGARKSGKVYLFAGTYTINGTISVPNNTTLAGAGSGTVITIPNSVNATLTAITNTTTGGNGTGVVIQDLKLDGNKAGQSAGNYGMYGITFNGMGSGTLQGGKILNVWVNNWYGNGAFLWTYSGIYISTGQRNTISNVTVQGNSTNGITITGTYNTVTGSDITGNNYGIHLVANNNTISGNSTSGNAAIGIYLETASQNTITGNVATGNTNQNIYLFTSSSNTVSGNQALGSAASDGIGIASTSTYNIISSNIIQANSAGGVSIASTSTNNTVTGNKIHNNGGNSNKGIYFSNSNSNIITNNTISDLTTPTSNNPINIDVNSANTYLSNNYFSSTAANGTIADASTTTVYVNQPKAEGGGQQTNRTLNDTAAFTFQKADGTNVLTVDTTNSKVLIAGALDTTTATTLSLGTATASAVSIGKAGITTTIAGDTSVTLNATTGTGMVCRNTGNGILSACDVSYLTPTTSNFIQNQAGTPGTAQTGNFNITGTGIAATLQATSLIGTSLDTATGVALNIGAAGTPITTAINLNQNVTVAATKTLRMAGDTRANITAIGAPTEGMMSYDTTNKQLLVYANGKWQADRSTATKIVAASTASQALKDGADYVATGTSDQNIINTALTAAAGGRVYLTEGTFTTDDVISIPNDTTLTGAGRGSLIKFANINGQTKNMITNTDTTATSRGVTVRDLQLDGNWTGVNTTGTIHGIAFSSLGGGSGSTARQGPTVLNTWVVNFLTYGIYLNNSPNGIVSGNNIQAGGGNGIYLSSSNRVNVTGNISQGNNGSGIVLSGGVVDTINSNTFATNGTAGIYVNGSSNNNTISGNNLYNNGGGTTNNAIYFPGAANGDFNTITSNTINDTSGTTNNYAINFVDNTSNSNYLADNVFTSTAGTSTINDPAGTNTVYANQPRAEAGGQLTNRTTNDTQAFAVQKADGTNVLAVDTTNSKVLIAGALDTTTATTLSLGTATASAVSIGKAGITTTIAGDTSVTLNATTGTGMVCRNTGNGILSACDVSYLTPTVSNFIQNSATQQAGAANFNISGSGTAATSLLTPLVDGLSGVLSLGTGAGSTSVTIGKTAASTLIASSNITVGTSGSTNSILGATQTTAATAGNAMVIQGSTGLNGNGGTVTVQGGNANGTGTLGGSLTLSGGTGSTSNGTVILSTAAFQTATSDASCFPGGTERTTNSNCTIAQSSVNNNASVLVGFTNDGLTAFLPDPSILTAGRVVYVTASNLSKDFTLSVNAGGQGNLIGMRRNTTATMIWNGADWTAAGASSSTTLQSAYDNTLQSAGGAELIVGHNLANNNTNGLTIRDSTVNPTTGALLTVQSSSAANLFSVNSNVTEYATDAGAEVGGGIGGVTDTTFPASTWSSAPVAATITRNTTTANIATGQGSTSVVTSTTALSGVKNQLSTTLTASQHYNVSFTAKLASGTFTDMEVYYSKDGTNPDVLCTNAQAVKTSVWTKVNCSFTAPSASITSSNAIFIRQTSGGTAHTFYVDNLSVTIAADFNYVNDGGADTSGGTFSAIWDKATFGGAPTGAVAQYTSDGQAASSSAKYTTVPNTAKIGIRNKLAVNPLPSTLYRVTVYAKSSTAMSDLMVRYTPTSATANTSTDANYVDCVDYNTRAIITSTWTKVTCYITTSATVPDTSYLYFVQQTAPGATRDILVDTVSMTLSAATTPNVQVGGGVNGGPTTLFTLDKGSSAPIAGDNDALLGSMYYDTTLGKLQCYEADGWGACGSSPDNIITISPEYTNAVLHGPSGGTSGIGTMTSDICSDFLNINDGSGAPAQPTICGTNESYNFYKWTTPQTANQTYAIYVTYQLPATFKSFNSGQTSLMARTDNGSGGGAASVTYKVYRNSGSGLAQCGAGSITVSTGTVASWQTGYATGAADPSACSFAAGNSILFEIDMTTNKNANAYVGNLNFAFSNK